MVDSIFADIASPEDLFSRVADRCTEPNMLKSVHLACSTGNPESILCFAEVGSGNASVLAALIGGQVFGFHTVLVTIPVVREFQCARRGVDIVLSWDCELCRYRPG